MKADALYDYVEGKRQEGKENNLCIDEVQLCRDFEKAVSWFYESGNYSIYITGSNAFLLSSNLATLFTGRTFEIEIFPFSFAEYMVYYELSDPLEALDSYITDRGFSGSYLYEESDSRYQYFNYPTTRAGEFLRDYFKTQENSKNKVEIWNISVSKPQAGVTPPTFKSVGYFSLFLLISFPRLRHLYP